MKKLLLTVAALATFGTQGFAATTYLQDKIAFTQCMKTSGFAEGKTFESKLKSEDGDIVGVSARVKESVLKNPTRLAAANACAKKFGIAKFG